MDYHRKTDYSCTLACRNTTSHYTSTHDRRHDQRHEDGRNDDGRDDRRREFVVRKPIVDVRKADVCRSELGPALSKEGLVSFEVRKLDECLTWRHPAVAVLAVPFYEVTHIADS